MAETITDTEPSGSKEPVRKSVGLSDRAYLGLITGLGAVGALSGLAAEIGDNAEGRQNAIVAEACISAYPGDTNAIGSQALNCMQNGFIPGSEKITDMDKLSANAPKVLIDGYIKSQKDAADTINMLAIGVTTLIGAGAGFWVAGSFDEFERKQAQARKTSS